MLSGFGCLHQCKRDEMADSERSSSRKSFNFGVQSEAKVKVFGYLSLEFILWKLLLAWHKRVGSEELSI